MNVETTPDREGSDSSAFDAELNRPWDNGEVWPFGSNDPDAKHSFASKLGLLQALQEIYHKAHGGWVPGDPVRVEVRFVRNGSLMTYLVEAAYPEDEGALDLVFHDRSKSSFDITVLPPGPLDAGRYLLEPITRHEFAQIEGVLAVLWEAVADGRLSEGQIAQIKAIHGLIEQTQRDTVPGETARWKLVAVVGRGLKWVVTSVPTLALGWLKLLELLNEAQWSETSESIKQLMEK